MPLVFGIPVEMNEAMRIFGLPYDPKIYHENYNILSAHLKQYDVNLFCTDKGQYIFGYLIDGLDMWAGKLHKNFVQYHLLIAKFQELAVKFRVAMKMLNADLREVKLYPMECKCYTVNYPEPVIIEIDEIYV